MSLAAALPRTTVVAWRNALFVVFALNGFVVASWLSRIPTIRDALHAGTGQMGWIVFAMAVGSIVGLTLASHVLSTIGSRRTISACLVLAAVAVTLIGLGSSTFPHVPLVVAGLGLLGLGMGMCDVSMNVEGAVNEQALGRTVMPLYHAMFSAGTIAGAGLGALAELLDVATSVHFAVTGVILVVGVAGCARFLYLDDVPDEQPSPDVTGAATAGWRRRLRMWTDARTLLIGLLVLGMAFAEGSANDWTALAMVDGHGVSKSTGAVVLGVFVTAMTVGRIAGVPLLDRFGRLPVLRGSGVLAAVGLLVMILVPNAAVAAVGVACWGLGAALGFPVGMSAAADDTRNAAARVSVVATIGYCAFLVGPPSIGFLGEHVGLLRALLLVLVLVVVATLVSPAAKERGPVKEQGLVDERDAAQS